MAGCSSSDFSFDKVLDKSLAKFGHVRHLKSGQKACIKAVSERKDVLAVLPTGYGKSLIFQILPSVLEELWCLEGKSTVIVVTPLLSIINDQVRELKRLGLKAFALGDEEDESELKRGYDADIVYGSAERWLSDEWLGELRDNQLGKQIVTLVVDEVHSVSLW
jgi:ATP-dependent DNA helicase RecQ